MLAPADVLTLSRLAIVPVLPVVATLPAPRVTMALIAWGLASDAIDGTVARLTGTSSDRGARLDSVCDLAFYSTAIVSFGLAYRESHRELLATLLVTGAALIVPSLFGWLKFATLPSYHTLLSRLALATFAMALMTFFRYGAIWPIRCAAILAAFSALDDMLITVLLREPRTHVSHSLSLLRNQPSPLNEIRSHD